MSCTKPKLLGCVLEVVLNCQLSLNSAGGHKVMFLLILGPNEGSLDSFW